METNKLLIYKIRNYENPAEREQFRLLCKQIRNYLNRFGEGLCVFVGNYNIGCELDALLIKKDAIVVIEFKNTGGSIVAKQNGHWTANGKEIKGGSRDKTVLKQAEINHSIVKDALEDDFENDPDQIKDVPTLIVFNEPIIKLDNQLAKKTQSWLYITDNEHFIEKISDIAGRKTNLSPRTIFELTKRLNLTEEFLFEDFSDDIEKIENWLVETSDPALQTIPVFAEEPTDATQTVKVDFEKENETLKRENDDLKKENKKLTRENKKKEKAREREQMEIIVESAVKSVVEKLGLLSTEPPQSSKSEREAQPKQEKPEATTPMPIQNETTLKQAESPIPVQVEKMDAVGLRETPIEEDEETKKQKAFIASVLSIYTNLPFNTEIFKNGDKRLNSIFAGKTFYKEKVIKVESANISDKATQIGGFIGKEVYKLSPDCIYWEDGDVITTPEKDGAVSDSPKNPTGQHPMKTGTIRLRKSNTSLPDWLDRKIFGELGAIYAPEHQRYEFNLDLNEDELKVYLGTYFPRSYAEMFCIADNLFQNEKYLAHLSKNKEGINIFDCGCGTGGEIVGLITALCKYLPQCKINVTAIDGNNGALRIADKLIRDFPAKYCPNINITTICQTFTAVDDFAILKGLNESYQFVLCNKIACELISKRILPSNNAYAILAECLVPRLADNGLLTILDVTTKDEDSGYFYPQLMNLGLNKFVSKNEGIETLLPLSCSFNEGCNDPCFMQQSFSVSHSHKSGDESRVCYRVICKKSLKNIILGGIHIDGNAHLIHPERYNQDGEYAICKHTKDKNIIIDSFNINL